jgi:hypothetical protein
MKQGSQVDHLHRRSEPNRPVAARSVVPGNRQQE